MRLIDFHAHVLPGIDDGAANVEESKKLLLSQKSQGIEIVVATPHYDHKRPIEKFVERREQALSLVRENIHDAIPEIVPAAEVALYCGLSEEPDLQSLCIGETNYILIEMPYFYWNSWDYDELYHLVNKRGVKPIIAHLDRYASTPEQVHQFGKLLEQDVLVQINSASLLTFFSRQVVKKIWNQHAVILLGSDCHDSEIRPCTLATACKVIKKKFGAEGLKRLMENAEAILENKDLNF